MTPSSILKTLQQENVSKRVWDPPKSAAVWWPWPLPEEGRKALCGAGLRETVAASLGLRSSKPCLSADENKASACCCRPGALRRAHRELPHPARVRCSLWQSWTLLEPWSLFVLSAGSLHAVPLTSPNILTNANCFFLYFVLTQEPQTTVIHNPDGNKVFRKKDQHRLALTRLHISSNIQSKINCLKIGKKILSLFLAHFLLGLIYVDLYTYFCFKRKKNDILQEKRVVAVVNKSRVKQGLYGKRLCILSKPTWIFWLIFPSMPVLHCILDVFCMKF